MLIDLIFGV